MSEKEHKDDPLRDAESSVNNETLQKTMEGRLSEFREKLDGEPAELDPEPEPSTPEQEPEPESEPEPEPEPEVDPEPEPESTLEEPEDGSKGTEDPPEVDDIPEGHVRAARRQGWSDEDIAEEIKANPDRARRLFQNAYETVNKATRDFAAIGRNKAEVTRKATEVAEPEIKDFISADEIAEVADGDKATAAVLKAMNQRIKEQTTENAKRNAVSANDLQFAKSDQDAATARANANADATALQMINQFFDADDMKVYVDFYGVVESGQDWNDITPRQKDHRMEVLQVADQLKIGKSSQGIEITAADALSDAHLLVTDSIREKVIAGKIKSSLKKRTKTLQPSKSKSTAKPATTGRAKNREEAIVNAGKRLVDLKKKGW